MSKKQQTQKEEYNEYDLIERGTFIQTYPIFWDMLYTEFPHLVFKNVVSFIGYILTQEDWSNMCQKDKKYHEYGYFTPETLVSQGISCIDRNDLKNMVYNMRRIEQFSNSKMDCILEIKHIDDDVAELKWFLLDRSPKCTPEISSSNSTENQS